VSHKALTFCHRRTCILLSSHQLSVESKKEHSSIDPAEKSFFERLQRLVDISPRIGFPKSIKRICGTDAFYSSSSSGSIVTAVASLLQAEDGRVLETCVHHGRSAFPYVSGIFFVHEGPFVVAAVEGLQQKPDLICFDAHGMSHPRGTGLATICGKILELPSIGVAKSRLVGEVVPYKEGLEKIVYRSKEVGFLSRCNDIKLKRYWSPGYAVSMQELEEVISLYSEVCIKGITLADQAGRSDSRTKT